MTNTQSGIVATPVEVLALIINQARRDGITAASGSLTDCARADNTFRTWANELRTERGTAVYRAAVNAYVAGKGEAVLS